MLHLPGTSSSDAEASPAAPPSQQPSWPGSPCAIRSANVHNVSLDSQLQAITQRARTSVAPSCTTLPLHISASACCTDPISMKAVPLKSRLVIWRRRRTLFTVPCPLKKVMSSASSTRVSVHPEQHGQSTKRTVQRCVVGERRHVKTSRFHSFVYSLLLAHGQRLRATHRLSVVRDW